jgi:PDGLE domain
MRWFTILALAVAVGLGTAFSPFASSAPDGLEKVAADKGFLDRGRPAPVQERAPIPDYAFPGVENARLATALAGFAGTLGAFLLGAGVVAIVRRPATA